MRKTMLYLLAASMCLAVVAPSVSADGGRGNAFAYGLYHFYQWIRDTDGDGIPNGKDSDWVRPLDGSGFQNQNSSLTDQPEEPAKTHYRHNYRYRYDEDAPDCKRFRYENQYQGTCPN